MSDDDRPADERREPADPAGSDDVGPDDADDGGIPSVDGDSADSPSPDAGSGSGEDRDWRFSLEDLADEGDESEGEGEGEGEGIAGVFGPSEKIEAGEIDRESVVFVLLGAIVALIGLYLMVVP